MYVHKTSANLWHVYTEVYMLYVIKS